MIATSQFTISVVNDGAPGATGPQGVSVTKVVEEYRLSNSSTELTGSGTGYTWSETKPDIPSGKYLWIRERTDLSNNTSSYGTAHCDIVISGLVYDVNQNTQSITSKVWQSDITNKINEYDGSTGAAIRDRVTQTETSITGITSRVSDVESETDSLGTRMTSAESSITQNANNIQSKVSQDGVISAINQSAESILISASKVDIQGAVSFSSLDSTLQSRITGVESTASTANATANTANATANTALKGMKVYSGTCSTAAGTAAKVVSCSDTDFEMTNGTTITIKFSTASTAASPTLNVNTKGAKAIYFDGVEVSSSNIFRWQTGSVITFQYDGTHWVVIAYQNLDYFICSTAAGTTAKATNSVAGTFVLCKGTTITVFFGTSNSVNAPTLNVGSTGAYAIYYKNAVTSANNQYLWSANTTVNFTYNGSYWYVNDGGAQLAKDYAKTAVDWVGTNGTTVVSAADIMKTWTNDATLATTTIDGGYIKTHTIESTQLATNAIMSQNYEAIENSHFSSEGTFLDLENGNFYTPKFGVNAENGGGAYINGEVVAISGTIGSNSTNYWEIGNKYDYNAVERGAIIGHGSSYIQAGNWQLSNDKLNTQSYVTTQSQSGVLQYYKDSGTNTFYDVGIKIPTSFTKGNNDSNADRYHRAFFYQRKYTGDNAPTLDGNWDYPFIVDNEGRVYCTDLIIIGGGSGTTYLPLAGGTITGNLTINGNFSTTVKLQTNLASTSAATLSGNANATVTHGVTGTLGVGNGGTGQTSAINAANAFLNALGTGSSTPSDNDYYISQYVNGGTTTTTYHRRPMSAMWNWIKGKIDSVYDITDTYRRLDDDQFDTIDVTDIEAGNLIVTGAGRFTNGLYGNLIGNADTATTATTATKVGHTLKIQLNSGTSEDSNQFTYNGSATKTVNITKASIGLGSVENTALSTWAGSSNLTTTKVGTLATAATKGVDTSISTGSTSTNLPTSKAVATFVEGKGYVTSSGVTSITLSAGSGISLSATGAITTTGTRTITNTGVLSVSESSTNGKISVNTGGTTTDVAIHGLAALAYKASLGKSDVGLGNVTNNAQVKGLSSGTTNGHFVTWGTDGYTVADSGVTKSDLISGIQISGSTLTITKADGTSKSTDITITASQASGATILTDAEGTALAVGDASHPTYFAGGIPVQGNVIPTITINGSTTTSPSFYAPTTVGTQNYALLSNGSGAPTWSAIVRGVKGNAESSYRTGQVNLTAANIGALALTGGTLTGHLDLPSNKYYEADNTYGIKLNNSDIVGINSLYFSDYSDNGKEAINFPRSTAGYWDSLYSHNGTLYYVPNRQTNTTGDDTQQVHVMKNYEYGTIDPSIRTLVDCARANRFAFLPASQIIVEKTTDGGATWVSAGLSDATKVKIFQGNNKDNNLAIPLLNGAKSTQCGVRITITAMKYNVPSGTAETEKYNYWNSNYVLSAERYSNLREFWFWVNTNNDRIRVYVESASGANSTTWTNRFNKDFRMAGWAGSNWVRVDNTTFGGGSSQTGNHWNWRFTFWSAPVEGSETFASATTQYICAINGYGDGVWNTPNNLMKNDHLYTWDASQNATFPAQITATQFNGNATSATKATQDGDGAVISSTYLKLSGGTMTGALKTNGTDIILGATGTGSAPNDSGDLVWQYGNGTEKMRIYTSNSYTVKHGPAFRVYNENNEQLYHGTLPLADGTDATGTWGISITGSATKATQDSDGNAINTTYLKLSGGTMTGILNLRSGQQCISFRQDHANYDSGFVYGTNGNEAIALIQQSAVTSFMVVHGSDPATWTSSTWTSSSPTIQTKNKSLYVNELIASGSTPTYNFKVNGTSYLGGETKISYNNADTESVSLKYNQSTQSLDFIFN